MSEPIYAYKVPRRSFLQGLFGKECHSHDWQQLTGTVSSCAHCGVLRKQLGVLYIEETGELRDCPSMLVWQIPTYNRSSDGWRVPKNGGAR